jgi:hypothetical protein
MTEMLLALVVIFIGLGSFVVAARMNSSRLAEERNLRGPGAWIGVLLSNTSVGFARAFFIVLGIAICALGVVDLSSHL